MPIALAPLNPGGGSGNVSLSFLVLPGQLSPQLYPLRARFNGVRESELGSFEAAATDFDELATDKLLKDVEQTLNDRITSLETGDTVTGLTYNGSTTTIAGLNQLTQRLESMQARLDFIVR